MASKTKLREGSKYFVADPDNVRFGKRIPLVCHYRGLHPEGHRRTFRHVFAFVGDPGGGYFWLTDKEVAKLVEPYSEARNAEIAEEANYCLRHLKIWRKAARQ